MSSLSGKTVVVTGGGQGISEALLEAGATLVIAQRSELPASLAQQSQVHWIKADLAQSSSYQAISDRVQQNHGQVDALANNARLHV